MSQIVSIVALLVGISLLSAVPASADEGGAYVSNSYQDAPDEWNDPWRNGTVGPRNDIETIDGHLGSGVRVTIDRGQHFGAEMRWRFGDNGIDDPDHLWYRYYLRFPEGFPNSGKGKLPGPAGIYSSSARGNIPSTAAKPGWSARMFFSPNYDERDADQTRIGSYLYHLDQETKHGDLWLWDEAVATLQHGQWYCVEGFVQMNTPGDADGILAGWVDGVEAFSKSGIRYRRASEPAIAIESFWFDVYFGGRQPAPAAHQIDFDSLTFGEQRLGCDDTSEKGFVGQFFDDEGSIHEAAIDELRSAGVIHGCNYNGDAFCPDSGVTRGEMAKLLARALRVSPTDDDFFSDDDGSPFESDINALASIGVTRGCEVGLFCPDRVMSRAEVAAFIDRALDLPATGIDHFDDDTASLFEAEINALAEAGLTSGCGNQRFCPDAVASRSEAATFVVRAMRVWEQLLVQAEPRQPVHRLRMQLPLPI